MMSAGSYGIDADSRLGGLLMSIHVVVEGVVIKITCWDSSWCYSGPVLTKVACIARDEVYNE